MNTIEFVPYTNHGVEGTVHAAALKTFQRKAAAVQVALETQSAVSHEDCAKRAKAFRTIIAANRKIRSSGWYFTPKA